MSFKISCIKLMKISSFVFTTLKVQTQNWRSKIKYQRKEKSLANQTRNRIFLLSNLLETVQNIQSLVTFFQFEHLRLKTLRENFLHSTFIKNSKNVGVKIKEEMKKKLLSKIDEIFFLS